MTLTDYGLIVSIIVGSASTILSIIALNISHKTFQQQKTFDNENHLYEYKFNAYLEILKKIVSYMLFVENKVFDSYDKYKNKEITEDELLDSADEIDDAADKLQNELASLVAFLPVDIIEEINKVIGIIYDNTIGEETDEEQYQKTQTVLNKIVDSMEKIELAMIKDLGIENIHKRLARRTRGDKPKSS